jgi:hypothetical protein
VDPRADLDAVAKRKNLWSCRKSNPGNKYMRSKVLREWMPYLWRSYTINEHQFHSHCPEDIWIDRSQVSSTAEGSQMKQKTQLESFTTRSAWSSLHFITWLNPLTYFDGCETSSEKIKTVHLFGNRCSKTVRTFFNKFYTFIFLLNLWITRAEIKLLGFWTFIYCLLSSV